MAIESAVHLETRPYRQRASSVPVHGTSAASSYLVTVSTASPTPLTTANLLKWDKLHGLRTTSTCNASLSSQAPTDEDLKLKEHSIYSEQKSCPGELQKHITTVVKHLGMPDALSADQLPHWTPLNHNISRADAIDYLSMELLFKTEREGGEKLIQTTFSEPFKRKWLPPARDGSAKDRYGTLEAPEPDITVGYITRSDAESSRPELKYPLNHAEEEHVLGFALTTALHFPFLTYQWERPSQGGQFRASQRAARNGAAIVHNMNSFCQAAEMATPTWKKASIIDKAHFSLTCDTETAQLWVHWLEPSQSMPDEYGYYMHCIKKAFLRPDDKRDTSLMDMRKMLRNILWYAVTKRLARIKTTIKALQHKEQEELRYARDALRNHLLIAYPDDPHKKRSSSSLEPESTEEDEEMMEGEIDEQQRSGEVLSPRKKQRID